MLFFVSFLKITNQNKKSSNFSQEQPYDGAPECCRPGCALNTVCAAPVFPLLGRKVHSSHSLSVSPGSCTCRGAAVSQLVPSSLSGLVTSCKTVLYKLSLKFLVLSSIFRKLRFHCRRENVWNKFRK